VEVLVSGIPKYDREALLAASKKHSGNVHEIAKELGCAESTVRVRLRSAGEKYGNAVVGTSTLYKDGEVVLEWIKTGTGKDELEQRIRDAFAALKDTIPKAKPTGPTKAKRPQDLMNVHILTDYHLGSKAWREEAGEDWDLSLAEDLLVRWFTRAIEDAPPAAVGVLAQLGDFLHWDGYDAVTPASKHLLDADTRFQKLVRVAIRTTRRIVGMMLKKYDRVHLIMADANHDPASGAWLREMFAAFYDDEPRITVDNSADTYYCLEHGQTSLFFHHGHKRKPAAVDDVFVAKFRDVFGRTKHSYAHLGHMHHDMKLETNLMTVEQHRTMAAKDAYASRGGWMAGRGAPVITYSNRFGEVGRQVYTPEMV
jgi:transposase-like protein